MNQVTPKDVVQMAKRYSQPRHYEKLKSSCESIVVKWRMADWWMQPQAPHENLLSSLPARKWIKDDATRGWRHGFDKDGRLVYLHYTEAGIPRDESAEFLVVHDEQGEWWFTPAAPPVTGLSHIERFESDDGGLRRTLALGEWGLREHTYRWENRRVVEGVERSWEEGGRISIRKLDKIGDYPFEANAAYRRVFEYAYAADGNLERVTALWYDPQGELFKRETPYQRIPKGMTMKSLLTEAEGKLVDAITAVVKAAKVKPRMYCMIVQFTGLSTDTAGFVPPLYLIPEATRDQLMSRPGIESPEEDLWFLGELECAKGTVGVRIKDEKLDETMNWIYKLTYRKGGNYHPVRQMFWRVCQRLNEMDWSKMLSVTEDFIVFPADMEGEFGVKVDIKSSVSAKQLKRLTDHGLI